MATESLHHIVIVCRTSEQIEHVELRAEIIRLSQSVARPFIPRKRVEAASAAKVEVRHLTRHRQRPDEHERQPKRREPPSEAAPFRFDLAP